MCKKKKRIPTNAKYSTTRERGEWGGIQDAASTTGRSGSHVFRGVLRYHIRAAPKQRHRHHPPCPGSLGSAVEYVQLMSAKRKAISASAALPPVLLGFLVSPARSNRVDSIDRLLFSPAERKQNDEAPHCALPSRTKEHDGTVTHDQEKDKKRVPFSHVGRRRQTSALDPLPFFQNAESFEHAMSWHVIYMVLLREVGQMLNMPYRR